MRRVRAERVSSVQWLINALTGPPNYDHADLADPNDQHHSMGHLNYADMARVQTMHNDALHRYNNGKHLSEMVQEIILKEHTGSET